MNRHYVLLLLILAPGNPGAAVGQAQPELPTVVEIVADGLEIP